MRNKKIGVIGVCLFSVGLLMLFFPLLDTQRYAETVTHIPINETLTELEPEAIWDFYVAEGDQIKIQLSASEPLKLSVYKMPEKLYLLEDWSIGDTGFSQTWKVTSEGTYVAGIRNGFSHSSVDVYGDIWVQDLRTETTPNQLYIILSAIILILGIATTGLGALPTKRKQST